MIDHVVLTVSDVERSLAFYTRALAPLGHTRCVAYPGHPGHPALVGLGDGEERYLMLRQGAPAPHAVHVAFVAVKKTQVRAFYDAALAAGGRDNGPPGKRAHYFDAYHAAYVLDPDGYNIEALFQG
ncbi:MAG TPA: VOC family protein [Myxococcota bacterium]